MLMNNHLKKVPSDLIKPTYKRSIPKRTDDNDNSMSIWDHCQVGADPRRISNARKKSSTHDKVDLRAHMAPHKEIDVYKVLKFFLISEKVIFKIREIILKTSILSSFLKISYKTKK